MQTLKSRQAHIIDVVNAHLADIADPAHRIALLMMVRSRLQTLEYQANEATVRLLVDAPTEVECA